MRITCPNCQAQYDVDPSMIPEAGRDVQCSSCAHTWFQTRMEDAHDEVEETEEVGAAAGDEVSVDEALAEEIEAGSTEEPDDEEPDHRDMPEPEPEELAAAEEDVAAEPGQAADEPQPADADEEAEHTEPEDEPWRAEAEAVRDEPEPAEDDDGPDAGDRLQAAMDHARQEPGSDAEDDGEDDFRATIREAVAQEEAEPVEEEEPGPSLDRDVAEILREEAEFEATRRRSAEAPPAFEAQADLDLDEGRPSNVLKSRLERMRGDGVPQGSIAAAAAAAGLADVPRRERLPDIEEINSSLRPGEGVEAAEPPLPPAELVRTRRAGFRTGFTAMILLVALAIGTYVYAPQIIRLVPASEPAMIGYVGAANAARDRIDGMMARALSGIERATGGANGA